MAFNNILNANQTGIQTLSSGGAWSGSTVTENGVLYGGATNAISSLAVSDTGKMLIGNTGAAPSFSDTPSVTSINFGGNPFSRYVEGTWTPGIRGSSSSGTASYNQQYGYYTRIGNRVIAQFYVDGSIGGSPTGRIQITALPFTVKNQTFGSNVGALSIKSALTWTTSTTQASLEPVINTTLAFIYCSRASGTGDLMNVQASTNYILQGTFIYQI